MKNTRSRAGRSTAKTDQQTQILDRLFDYFSKPKGEKPSSDSDIEVSFYRSSLNALPHNYHDAGSPYFCESSFWASKPKFAAKA